jgi:putative tryptophan/tyrosine transport system substrate-binding protein
MRLIGLVVLLAVILILAPLTAEAQQAGKVYRIGALSDGPNPASAPLAHAMRELGWVAGQNFMIEQRNAEAREQLSELAAELVRLKVDLIFAFGTLAAQAAKDATKTIPIVFRLGDDPVATGLVASFARPGGNLTGFALGLYEDKLLEVLKEALPRVSRVAYPFPADPSPGGPESRRQVRLTEAARTLGVELRRIEVRRPPDFDAFFAAAKRQGTEAVLVPNIVWFRPLLVRIGEAAARSRLPTIGYDTQFALSGGLLSYGPVSVESSPRLAVQIDKILKGTRPADLPVEQPTKFELVINLKTAKALGLTIPQSLLVRADEIIR